MKLSDIAKRMIRVIVICAYIIIIVGAVLSFLYTAKFLPIALGAVFGAAISILKVIMIDRTVKKTVGMKPETAGNYVRMQHLLRFAVTGVLFIVAAMVPFINIFSAAAGILSFQAATMSMRNTWRN